MLALLIALVPLSTADGLTVELPAAVAVEGLELTLGSIATVTGDDAELVERARATRLGYAPAPGYRRVLDGRRLAADLERSLGVTTIELAGAQRCVVTPRTTTVSGGDIANEAVAVLAAAFEGTEARITAAGTVSDLEVPAALTEVVLEAELFPDGSSRELGAGSWTVPVRVVVDGETYRTVFTPWTVELWQSRQVLRRAVRAGESLSPDDFEIRRVPVGTGPESHAIDPGTLGQAVARRDLPAGSLVTERDVQRTVVLRKGDLVSLEIARGGVVVRALATALVDGRVGDRVRVRCDKTQKELVAVVRSRELVELRIP